MAKKTEPVTGINDPFDGDRISKNVIRGIDQRKAKSKRWGRNRAYYFNDPPEREDAKDEGSADHHFPLVQPFSDALGGWIVQTVTSVEPYCVPSLIEQPEQPGMPEEENTDDIAEDVQEAVWRNLKKANLRDALRRVAQPSCWANCGIIWASWTDEGLKLDVVDPTRFVVYPSSRGIKDAVLYGRSFDRTRGEIRALAKKGYYFYDCKEDEIDEKCNALTVSGLGGQSRHQVEDHPGQTDTVPFQTSPHFEDDLIELHEVIVREPSDGSVKIITIHTDSQIKLKESPYQWKTPCAFKFQIKPEATDEFWTEGSLAQDMQGSQEIVNRALCVWDDGMTMATYGAGFASQASASSASKVVKYKPGTITYGVGLENINMFSPQIDVSGCPLLIDFIKSHMSAVTRLSSLGAGGALKSAPGGTTAREVEQATAGQSTGVDDYVDTFTNDLPILFTHVQELSLAFDDLVRKDPDLMVSMAKDYEWNVQVNSPMNTPRAQFQALGGLYQIANDPDSGLKKREITKRILQSQEAMGVTDATGLQAPEDPVMAVTEALGLPPEAAQMIAPHVQQIGMEIQALQDAQNQMQAPGRGQSPQTPGPSILQVLGQGDPSGTPGPTEQAG